MQSSLPERVLSVDEWNDKSNTKFFKRYEGPYRMKIVKLGNHPIRKVLEKQFEYMSRNLYFISAFGRFLLGHTKEEEVAKAEDIAKRTIMNATESMQKRITQAKILLKNTGNENEETFFSKQFSLEVPITTPGANLYAELLRLTDEFYTINYMLWVDGEIDNPTKFKNESDARVEVQRVVRGIASQFLFILNLTRKKNHQEADKAGAHDEKKLEDAAVDAVDTEIGAGAMTGSVAGNESVQAEPAAGAGKRKKAAAEKTDAAPAEPAVA